ncbi:YihY/virulence factor BrkB family protein [Arthrobacter castelli]|uniref:YihY/virulence factor BrkB family protein n=1 Tax=Arthrobacter castelli TaxID=271431 RepID=UPI0004077C5E|nr:YihY/virulence factor BrkB family protein [Arthrobacter castelli]
MAVKTRTRNPALKKTAGNEPPAPTERARLKVTALDKRRAIGKAKREGKGFVGVALATLMWLLAKVNTLKPMRSFKLYAQRHGPLMAAGISYNMFFAVAAMLVAGFSILSIVAAGNREFQQLIVSGIDRQVPKLIDTGEGGLATPEQLFSTGGALSITLVISTLTMLYTALRWISSLREGMRGVFDLLPLQLNVVLAKLKDLGTLVILAIAMVVTLGVGVVANTLLDTIIDLLNLGAFAGVLTQVAGTLVMLLLDMVVAVIMFRLASGIKMPRLAIFQASLLAAIGSTVLRTFSTQLLGSAGDNPLLAPFAVILGLFVWFFLLSQVYLISTAWGAVTTADVEASRARNGKDRLPSLRQRAREAAAAKRA